MSGVDLTQTEADTLIHVEKHCIDNTKYGMPMRGEQLTIPLASANKREKFILDMHRGNINLQKITHQMRGRGIIVLVRLDIEGPPHRNPDGEEVPCPHLHLYREGYGDKWAKPIDISEFPHISDMWQTLHDFMQFCNITQKPRIERGLFA